MTRTMHHSSMLIYIIQDSFDLLPILLDYNPFDEYDIVYCFI